MLGLSSKYTGVPEWILTKAGSYKRNIILATENNDIVKKEQETVDEKKQNQDELRKQRAIDNAVMMKHIKKERNKINALVEQEVQFLSTGILSSMTDLTDDEIVRNSMILLYNSEALEKFVSIYMKNTKADLEDFMCRSIARKSLLRVIETVSLRKERAHKEFPQVEVVKTISL